MKSSLNCQHRGQIEIDNIEMSARVTSQIKVSKQFSKLDAVVWRILIWTVGLATPFLTSLKPRRFLVGDIDFIESERGLNHIVSEGLYFFLMVLACVAFLRYLRKKDGHKQIVISVFWMMTILLALMPTISTVLSGGKNISLGIFGALMIYVTTYFLSTPSIDWWIREVRIMLLVVFVYGSLAAAILFPDWAWNPNYADESSIALLPMRLFGTANHANALAPLVILSWILGRFPNCRLRGEYLHGIFIFIVFILAQSKTSWVIAILLVFVSALIKIRSFRPVYRHLFYLTGAIFFFSSITYILESRLINRLMDLIYDPKILTLSGRVQLWIFAIGMWLDRPWLGQGLDAWSSKAILDYIDILGWAAPHAHNQVLQILSQSGIIGLGVAALCARYFIKIVNKMPQDLRTPLSWLSVFYFLSGFTEVIFQFVIGTGDTVFTWTVFTTVLIAGKSCYTNKKNDLNRNVAPILN